MDSMTVTLSLHEGTLATATETLKSLVAPLYIVYNICTDL